MSRKPSKGVIFWAWWFIISAISSLAKFFIKPQTVFFPSFSGTPFFIWRCIAVLMTIALAVIFLTCGILLLRLREDARKGTIFACCAYFFPLFFAIYWERQHLNKIYGMAILPAILPLISIYFFTRPRVKEQFKVKSA